LLVSLPGADRAANIQFGINDDIFVNGPNPPDNALQMAVP
jgi:hypothetical protein